ncbi:MAG: hypothetical protein Q7S34_00330 [bacterium]|nr:hypothetical protein [bacterium]
MKPKLLAAFVAIVLVGGYFYFLRTDSSIISQEPKADVPVVQTSDQNQITPQNQANVENVTNYDECIAAGNPPLSDAPDKCLTKNGHIFIRGVVE